MSVLAQWAPASRPPNIFPFHHCWRLSFHPTGPSREMATQTSQPWYLKPSFKLPGVFNLCLIPQLSWSYRGHGDGLWWLFPIIYVFVLFLIVLRMSQCTWPSSTWGFSHVGLYTWTLIYNGTVHWPRLCGSSLLPDQSFIVVYLDLSPQDTPRERSPSFTLWLHLTQASASPVLSSGLLSHFVC